MTAPPAGALEACLALLEKATPGEWDTCYRGTYGFGPESDVIGANGEDVEGAEFVTPPCNQPTTRGSLREVDAAAIAAAVNLLRTHGPALLAALRLREWRPIAEAPKDQPVLVLFDGTGIPEIMELTRSGWVWANGIHRFTGDHPPTHWMPLPAPPTADDLARVLEEGE